MTTLQDRNTVTDTTQDAVAGALSPLFRVGLILLVGCCLCASLIGSLI